MHKEQKINWAIKNKHQHQISYRSLNSYLDVHSPIFWEYLCGDYQKFHGYRKISKVIGQDFLQL